MKFAPVTPMGDKHAASAETMAGMRVRVSATQYTFESEVRIWAAANGLSSGMTFTADEARTLAAELLTAADSLVGLKVAA